MHLLFLLPFLLLSASANALLTPTHYASTCPSLPRIVLDTVTSKQISTPTTAAGALRLLFHDCFLNGCDASALVSSTPFSKAERDADINLSLPGDAFDVVVRIKSALEVECPGVVSCADVLVLAVRDLVVMLGGPFFEVGLGRRDGVVSRASDVEGNLPRPTMSMSKIISLFASRGFTVQEMVALTGAHTVGFAHCKEFASRVFGTKSKPTANPTMNLRYVEGLKKACDNYQNRPTIAAFNDIMTPNKFDNMYYQNLPKGLGLMASDAALLTDPRTRPFVQRYAANQTSFFEDFVHAIQKLGSYGVKTGQNGEIRRRCDQFNS